MLFDPDDDSRSSRDHELKYVLPAAAAAPARALLAGLCRPEAPHPRNRVGTIYFDDRALDAAHGKLASDFRKTKVRLRWYDDRGPVFLEVKARLGSRREKFRRELGVDAAALAEEGLAAAARSGVSAALVAAGFAPAADLAPALRLAYLRERFVDRASGARLCLDTAIAPLELAPWCALAADALDDGDDLDVAVVESKGGARELPPALAAIAALGARRRSFSKYTACLLSGTSPFASRGG